MSSQNFAKKISTTKYLILSAAFLIPTLSLAKSATSLPSPITITKTNLNPKTSFSLKSFTLNSSYIFKLAPEISYITYEEPETMRQQGPFWGFDTEAGYRDNWLLSAQVKYATGYVDYTSLTTGDSNGTPNYLFEPRLRLGYDFKVSKTILTPYLGFGYRRLYDADDGSKTTTGHAGYDRVANYWYSPIGAEIAYPAWRTTLTLEYDYFWRGRQQSYPPEGHFINTQKDGYGLRSSLRFKLPKTDILSVEAFCHYWKIDDSNFLPPDGFHEPHNHSLELGIGLIIGSKNL